VPLGTLHASKLEGPIQTLRHPVLSYWAAKAFFLGRESGLPPLISARHREVSLQNSLLLRYAGGSDVLSERLLEASASELCRLRRNEQCAAVFARWQLDRPGSPRFKQAINRARKASRAAQQDLSPAELRKVRMLFDGKVPDVPEAALARQAEKLTERYMLHYHHPVPFDRRIIEAAWRRCTGKDCKDKQDAAWRQLSSLDANVQQLSHFAAPSDREDMGLTWDDEQDADSNDDALDYDAMEDE
jgi:hypothetical protein